MGETGDEAKGFKVNDRRAFTSDGELRDKEAVPASEKQEQKAEPAPRDKKEESPRTESARPPEVGFMDLINMLVSNALMQLGDMPDPVSGKSVENPQGAQVMIAFLTMLQQKTKGNLDKDEAKVLDDVLYDLRMRFMAKTNVIKR
jgi:hypothetical protein